MQIYTIGCRCKLPFGRCGGDLFLCLAPAGGPRFGLRAKPTLAAPCLAQRAAQIIVRAWAEPTSLYHRIGQAVDHVSVECVTHGIQIVFGEFLHVPPL